MKKIRNLAVRWSGVFAALALILAVSSAGATCIFTSYQPEMPEVLKKNNR